MVLNPTTGHISPQYHIVFDDTFSTVPHLRSGTKPDDWINLVQTSSEKVTDEAYRLSKTWTTSKDNTSERGSSSLQGSTNEPNNVYPSERGRNDNDIDSSPSINHNLPQMPPMIDLPTAGLQRSNRTVKKPKRFGFFTKFCLHTHAAITIQKYNHPLSFVSRVMQQIEK